MRISEKEGVSVLAFSRSVGVSESAIRQAVKSGRLSDAVFTDGSLDEVKARVLWYATTSPRGPKSSKPKSKLAEDAAGAIGKRGINDVKLEKLEVDLEAARLELAVTKRESIPYSEARRALAAFMRLHRDMALQFAVRHGPAIAADVGCEEGVLIAAISSHMRDALNEAMDGPRPFPRAVQSTPVAVDVEPGAEDDE